MSFDQSTMVTMRYKLVVIGDISVGKTSIITRFIEDKFKEVYDSSIGVDFSSKNVRFKGMHLKLQIWDTAGQEKYKSLIPSYIRNSSIVLIIYDITSKILIKIEKVLKIFQIGFYLLKKYKDLIF